jgi:hypothetical protein
MNVNVLAFFAVDVLRRQRRSLARELTYDIEKKLFVLLVLRPADEYLLKLFVLQ